MTYYAKLVGKLKVWGSRRFENFMKSRGVGTIEKPVQFSAVINYENLDSELCFYVEGREISLE